MRKFFLFLLIFSCVSILFSQNPLPPTPAKTRIDSHKKHQSLKANSWVSQVPFESVGPTVFSGRVVDLAVSPTDPTHFYVAYASGGLWKTTNNGTTFTPIFDQEMVMTIGDIAVDWKNNIIWVGTGENNSSRSSYSGVGIYKSIDDGKTWEHKGLDESHHIGRIILHPTDPNTVWVASLGHLYSPNKERGIYKTIDGGTNWEHTLFVNENAGGIDLVISPNDPNKLYAATWERTRRAWNFVESGKGSGIHKSIDGGKTWTLVSKQSSGFPSGEGVGRIGLALYEKNGKEVLYALLDNYDRRPAEEKEEDEGLTKEDFRSMSKEDFMKLEKDQLKEFLQNNRFPKKYSAKKVMAMVKKGKVKPSDLTEYLEDANSLLFDTPVIGAEVYRSVDGGQSWKKTHDDFLDQVYNSYGYYFGNIAVSPHDPDKIYIMGFMAIRSNDGGKTFTSMGADNVHVDHHPVWANPNRDEHIIIGNDGGVNISYDDGNEWIKCNSVPVGQFYYVAVDMAEPYNIYGGLQDNGVWMGPNTYDLGSKAWNNSGHYPYTEIMGGDGMQIAIDTRDNSTVYTGYQYGNYFRLNTKKESRKYITPKHELGERPLRWNWQSPIHLSEHNQDILYLGSNKLFRSMNQGSDFKAISGDLTKGGQKGDVAYGTLTAIHESPFQFGLIYTGSDDGLVHCTNDGGVTWKNISKGLPENLWVTRIQSSQHEEGRVYISLNAYRWDNFEAFIYFSDDYGMTWQRIGNDLPHEPVNVIKEDPTNENILYIGSDHGLYISLDRGKNFMLMDKNLPAVPVHDVVVHPKNNDLIVGTHGRSIYKSNMTQVQQLDNEILGKNLHVFSVDKVNHNSRWGRQFSPWRDAFEPEIHIPYFQKTKGKATIVITNKEGLELASFTHDGEKGINYAPYDLSIKPGVKSAYEKFLNEEKKKEAKPIKLKETDTKKIYLKAGTYTLTISKDKDKVATEMMIKSRR